MRIQACIAGIAAALLAPLPVQSAPSSQAPPSIDAALRAKIDADVQGLLSTTHTQAATIAIAAGGKIVYVRGYGLRDVGKSLPADAQTHYEVGSITKQFAAAATLQLNEAGKIDLDALLSRYLPKAPHAGEVTIRQLLAHTSGFPDFVGLPNFDTIAGTPVTFDQLMARIADKSLDFKPGTHWRYSSTNYLILGRVIEVVSGQSWPAYAKQHLFARAGMTDSSTIAQEAKLADMARGYTFANGQTVPSKPIDESWASAAGDVVTTVGDLQKWSDALSSGRIISTADYRRLTERQRLANGSSVGYGFGMYVDTFEGQPRIWHNGDTAGFAGSNQFFPNQGVRIIALTNSADSDSDQIVAHVYNDLFPSIAAAFDPIAGEDAGVTARIKAFVTAWRDGHVDRSQLTDEYSKDLSDAAVARISTRLSSLGTPAWEYRGKDDRPDGPLYTYRLKYPKATIKLLFQIDPVSNTYSGMLFTAER